MTTALLAITRLPDGIPRSSSDVTLSLRDIHGPWLDETTAWLAPAISPDADFWNGWSAVRYINDQFDRQYQRQRAFIIAILPLLSSTDAYVLRAMTARLERVRRSLDRLGRQQGMTKIVAAACSQFLELLEAWFAELHWLTRGFTRAELPARARKALRSLKVAVAILAGPAHGKVASGAR